MNYRFFFINQMGDLGLITAIFTAPVNEILPDELVVDMARTIPGAWGSFSGLCRRYNAILRQHTTAAKEIVVRRHVVCNEEYWALPNGTKHGRWRQYYYDDGDLQFDGEYVDGKLHGKYREYYSDRDLKCETDYVRGVANGTKISYYRTGEVWIHENLVNGVRAGKLTCYYTSDRVDYDVDYVDGKKNGQYTYYIDDYVGGYVHYRDDIIHGEERRFYQSGAVRLAGNWVNGQRHGRHREFSETGEITKDIEYFYGDII